MKNKFIMGDLSTWGLIPRLLFAALCIVVVCSAYYFLYGKEQQSQVDSLKGSLEQKFGGYEKKAKDFAELKYIREEVELLKGVLKETVKNLPTDKEWPQLVNDVYNTAKDNDITFSRYQPQKPLDEEYYRIQPIALEAETGYLNTASLVEKLTSLNRIMNVESITLESTQAKKIEEQDVNIPNLPLKLKGELRTYIFRDE